MKAAIGSGNRVGRGQGAHRRDRADRGGGLHRHRHHALPGRLALRRRAVQALHLPQIFATSASSGRPRPRPRTFGGDPDNFNFPRYSMDASFLRAYENGKPVATPQHLKWTARAPVEGEATFVVGNPGSTQRLLTQEPDRLRARSVGADQRRDPVRTARPPDQRHGAEPGALSRGQGRRSTGSRTASRSISAASRRSSDPAFMGKIAAAEADLKAKSAGNPAIGDPWGDVAGAMTAYRELYLPCRFLEPQSEPLRLCRDAGPRRDRARQAQWRAPARLQRQRAAAARKAIARRAPDHAVARPAACSNGACPSRANISAPTMRDTRLLLGKESPEALAARLVKGTRMADPAVRKQLWNGGLAAINASTDPMIVLARKLDPRERAAPGADRRALRRPADRGARQARRCALRGLWRQRLSRRDLHAAHQLRQGPGLDRARPPGPDAHADGRHLRPRHRVRPVRPADASSPPTPSGSTAARPMTSSPPTTSSAAIRARPWSTAMAR